MLSASRLNMLGLVALVSTNSDLYFKVPVVNLAIKWLLLNPVPDETLHSVLSSINIHCITFPKLARVRIAIYLYLKTPELYMYFDINFAAPGVVFIRRKSGIPNDSEEYNDQEKMWIYKAINSITDGYVNPSYPQGTRRNDPDGVKPKSGKLKYTEQFADVAKELENPIFKWDFENKGTAYVHKEPVVQDPLTAPHPMEFAPPRRGFVEYYSPKKEEKKVEEKRIEKSPPKSPQQQPLVPPVVQNESVRKPVSNPTKPIDNKQTPVRRLGPRYGDKIIPLTIRPGGSPPKIERKETRISTKIEIKELKISTKIESKEAKISTKIESKKPEIPIKIEFNEPKIPTNMKIKEPEIPQKPMKHQSVDRKKQIPPSPQEPRISMEALNQRRDKLIEKKIGQKSGPKFYFDSVRNVLDMI
ncbi:hypothetical protein GCK72_002916 [Caenorhabditis remanei]|uniref:Uncharacterized protein n=1 Tax=Caenorhabditis remanei TaxID=31234 RepID=A0A6A5HVB4_CAERE|nr:hypothetical protein GCK72_002916 [Caenorhabditis remanei]KAF1771091.1 hypothetical protein GCK72_002916 [Caenorhabditis remanei]